MNDSAPTMQALVTRLRHLGADIYDNPSSEDAAYWINACLASEAVCGMATVNGKRVMKFRQWFEHIYGERWVVPAYLLRERAARD